MSCVVPPSPHCPVTGLVGVCKMCESWASPEVFAGEEYRNRHHMYHPKKWNPPPMVRPVADAPVYLIRRGFCDEDRLISSIRATWERIPEEAHDAMRLYLGTRPDVKSLQNGPLRVEALPCWPGRQAGTMGVAYTTCNAIRLRSVFMDSMPDEVLSTLIAHELGHVYQFASGTWESLTRQTIEPDVHHILNTWGFRQGAIGDWSNERAREERRAKNERWESRWEARQKKKTA